MKYFLTLDVGTTAVKAGLFTERLERAAFAVREYALDTPGPELVELNPEVYWDNARIAVREALDMARADASDVLTVTCTTQGETLIPVDSEGRVLHKAIVWLDARAKEEARWLSGRVERMTLYQKTGLPEINGYTPLAKLLWFRRNRPDVYEAAHKFLLLEDFLVYRLCGRFVTNPALMCTTGYFDIQRDEVWRESLDIAGLDADKIPEVVPSGVALGHVRADCGIGLPTHVLVVSGAMDQVASAIGSGNMVEGIVTETTGTCQAVAATVDKALFPEWSPVTYYSHAIPGKLLKIVINQTAGIAYKWFRDEFCPDLTQDGGDAFERMNELAAREPALSRGLSMFPHMTGMQFPVTDERARGVFFGAGLDATRGCFIRAIMEGVGYMLRESIETMGVAPKRVISLGGGAKSALWEQLKADICGTEFCVPEDQESTSLGAAMLGGVAASVFPNLGAACERLAIRRSFTPEADNVALYARGYGDYLRMYERFAPLFQESRRNDGNEEAKTRAVGVDDRRV